MVELSVALHKYSMYPDGHPLLESAVSGLTRRLTVALVERQMIAIAVARNHLVVDGVATDPAHIVTRDLALRLFRREIGAIRLYEGLKEIELQQVLRAIARDTPRVEGEPEPAREWKHVRLFPLTYDQLELAAGCGRSDGGRARRLGDQPVGQAGGGLARIRRRWRKR